MSGDDKNIDAAKMSRMMYEEMERKLQDLLSPENIRVAQANLDSALQTLGEKAIDLAKTGSQVSKESLQTAQELISELMRDLTGIVSFNIIPRPPAELEVDIRLLKENELPLKQPVAPFVDVEAICIGKRVHFQALLDKEKNGLRCNINEGFAVRFTTPLGKPTVPIQGTVMFRRDDQKQIVMETTTLIPGTTMPVSLSIPLKQLLKEARKKVF